MIHSTAPTGFRICTSRGRSALYAVLFVSLLFIVGAWPDHATAQEARIGVLVPLTGPLAPLGIDMRNGAELAAKHVGKIKGAPIKLIMEDTQANAATGLRKAQKLVLEDKVHLLFGGASSAVVLGIGAQSQRLNVPMVTTNSQAVQTTGEQCNRYLFRTNPNDAMMAKANGLLMQARPELLKKKWFVVFHDFVWGQSNKGEFAKIPGIQIVGEAGRPLGTADWSSAIAQIRSSGADAIYLALAVGDDMPAFIRQARSFGLKQTMLPPLGMPDSMLQALGDDAIGMVAGGLFGSWMLEEGDKKMAAFVKDYHAAYGIVPGPQAIQSYAGMRLTLVAMQAAKSFRPDDLITAMEQAKVDSIIGPHAIRKQDHQGTVGTYIAEAVKLPAPRYNAKVGWKVVNKLEWDQIKIDLPATGCKGI